jgi:hypothetical protein
MSSDDVTTASSSFWWRDLFLRRKTLTDKISDQASEIAAREAIRLFIDSKVAPREAVTGPTSRLSPSELMGR